MNLLNKIPKRKEKLELNSYNVELSPIYSDFIRTYQTSKEIKLDEKYYSPKHAKYKSIGGYSFYIENEDDYIEIYELFSIEEMQTVYGRVYEDDPEINGMNLYPIGSGSMDTMIFVGVGDDNKDEIFLERTSSPRILKVSNNIFDFIINLHFIELEEIFLSPYKYSQLYKNWGEDFWSVKD